MAGAYSICLEPAKAFFWFTGKLYEIKTHREACAAAETADWVLRLNDG